MEHLKIPKNYHSALNLHDTQIAIKTVKDFFKTRLRKDSILHACPHHFL